MGLLRDLLIKDEKKKRRVTMIIHLCLILFFLISMFIPQINNIAYEEGYRFGRDTCWVKISDFLNQTNQSGELNDVGFEEDIESR